MLDCDEVLLRLLELSELAEDDRELRELSELLSDDSLEPLLLLEPEDDPLLRLLWLDKLLSEDEPLEPLLCELADDSELMLKEDSLLWADSSLLLSELSEDRLDPLDCDEL